MLESRKTRFKKFQLSVCASDSRERGCQSESKLRKASALWKQLSNSLNEWFYLEHRNASLTSARQSLGLLIPKEHFRELSVAELPSRVHCRLSLEGVQATQTPQV